MDEINKENRDNTTTKDSNYFLRYIIIHLKRLISLNVDSDHNATINRIEEGISFRGTNIWILAFAIIIACVGLNVNSTAVIIGAMLLSPLMGPILGVGLAVGIHDFGLLNRSLRNFGIMVLISITASTLYFLISPLSDAQSELLARTQPTIYDVLIAFFGGMAGIVAHSRKGDKVIIILGVAIATALMPPLCTAGYGLATGQFNFFFGAFYLFFINTFFIALATVLMIYYLKIPQRSFVNPKRAKTVKLYIYIFTAIVCIPSILGAFNMIKETSFNSSAIRFVNDLQKNPLLENSQIISSTREYSRKNSTISLVLIGDALSEQQIENIKAKLPEFGLKNTDLVIRQPMGNDKNFMEELYKKNAELSDRIVQYEDELIKIQAEAISNEQIAKEIRTQFNSVNSFSIARMIYTDIKTLKSDTVPTLYVQWSENPSHEDAKRLNDWLKVRLKLAELKTINDTVSFND